MRSLIKRPGTALLAAAALFAVVTTSTTANAFTFRGTDTVATQQNGPESVQTVAVSRWEAWRARRDVAQALREDCRQGDTRSEQRQCFREAQSQLRTLRQEARNAYRECRNAGGSTADCRQAARAYWVDQAASDGSGSGNPGDAPPRTDD